MNKENKLKGLIGITGGIINSLEGIKEQSKQIIKSKITNNIKELNFVNREEFDEMKAMLIKAREKNTELEKKIKYLENKIKKL